MIDIVSTVPGLDMGIFDTDVERSKNILSVQIGALTYLPDFGIDLKYFLSDNLLFENESFNSYCVQRLANYGINVTEVIEVKSLLSENLTFKIGSSPSDGSLIAR
jgi:uncharacterized protein (DUF488 family)